MGFLDDVKMGLGLKEKTQDYKDRTEKTKSINKAISSGDTSAFKDDPAMMSRYKRESMMDRMGGASDNSGIKSISGGNTPAEEDMSSIYDENRRRYEEFMKNQQPQQPSVTPEMRQAALQTFESQQGAGQVPYYMAAARNQYNPNMSPAFQYAAQNYDVLGGSQRLAPRPMEMMSVAERGQINDMAQAMADQEAKQRQAETDYQAGMDMVMRGGMGKGGPRTGPQFPENRMPGYGGMGTPPTNMPRFGGKGGGGVEPQIPPMRQPPSRQPVMHGGRPIPFASILASRFGGFGGQ
jgi:hypothetical protein